MERAALDGLESSRSTVARKTRYQRLLDLLLQPLPVRLDLLLDPGVVHDSGCIEGVGQEIPFFFAAFAQFSPQVGVAAVEQLLLQRRRHNTAGLFISPLTVQFRPQHTPAALPVKASDRGRANTFVDPVEGEPQVLKGLASDGTSGAKVDDLGLGRIAHEAQITHPALNQLPGLIAQLSGRHHHKDVVTITAIHASVGCDELVHRRVHLQHVDVGQDRADGGALRNASAGVVDLQDATLPNQFAKAAGRTKAVGVVLNGRSPVPVKKRQPVRTRQTWIGQRNVKGIKERVPFHLAVFGDGLEYGKVIGRQPLVLDDRGPGGLQVGMIQASEEVRHVHRQGSACLGIPNEFKDFVGEVDIAPTAHLAKSGHTLKEASFAQHCFVPDAQLVRIVGKNVGVLVRRIGNGPLLWLLADNQAFGRLADLLSDDVREDEGHELVPCHCFGTGHKLFCCLSIQRKIEVNVASRPVGELAHKI